MADTSRIVKWLSRWFGGSVAAPVRPEGQACLTCVNFNHCDPDDEYGIDGYCMDGIGEYGGHWTSSREWCKSWASAIEAK